MSKNIVIRTNGANEFTELIDTQDSYVGYAGYAVVVNGSQNGLSFFDISGTFATKLELSNINTDIEIYDESNLIGSFTKINFVGYGISAANAGNGQININVSGGGLGSTDDLVEGVSNIYYTDERVDDRISSLLIDGEGINLTYSDISNELTISAEDASSINKGIASFNATNFSVSSGDVNTIQDIDTTANPTFFDLKISNINPDMVLVSDSNNQIKSGSTTSTQLSYLYGVTSPLQTQLNNKQNIITGAVTTVTSNNLESNKVVVSDSGGKVTASSTTSTQLSYLYGVTSPLQTQLNAKQNTITGAASTITSSNLDPNKVVVSDSSGKVTASSTTSTQLSYLYGVTSPLQTQLNAKEPTLTKGNLTETGSDVLTIVGGTGSIIGSGTTIQVQQASSSTDGFLSATDWNSFNSNTGTGSGSSTFLGLNDVANKTFLNYGLYGIRVNANQTHLEFVNFFNLFQEGEGINISKSGDKIVVWGEEATSTNKGIASFNSTNLPVSDGVVNTSQDINSSSSPIFTSLTLSGLTANKAVVSDASKQLISSATTDTEIGYLSGVTSGIQSQLNAKQDTITGAVTTVTTNNLEPNKVVVSDSGGKVTASSITSTQLSYLYGVTSPLQIQLNTKQNTITGAVTTVTSNDLDPNKVVVSDSGGKVTASSVTSTQLSYLYSVTSPLQTQLNSKQDTIIGAASTVTTNNLELNKVVVSDSNGKITSGSTTSTQLSYLYGVTSNIQNQFSGKQDTITGAVTTVTSNNLEPSKVVVSDSGGKVTASSTTSTQLSYLYGVTSPLQTQLNAKQDTITGAVTTVTTNNLDPNKVVVSDSGGKVTASSTTSTQLSYLYGVTSNIQSQFSGKQDTITGAASTVTSNNLEPNKVVVSDSGGKVTASSTTSIQLSYLYGVASPLQTQLNAKQDTITGAITTVTSNNLDPNKVVVSDSGGKVTASSTTSTQLSYLYGVTSPLQTQLNAKQNTITGAATTIASNNLEPDKVVVSDSSGKVSSGSTTSTQLSYLYGVTSPLQTQLNGKQTLDATLTALAGLSTSADQMIYSTGSDAFSMTSLTSFARTILDDADQATAQSTLGVDPAGTDNSTDVTLAGTPDYITIVGQVITRNQIDLTTDVTGDLPLLDGGTNASLTAVDGGIVYSTDTALAISAAGNSGQIFQSAGTGIPVWTTATYPATATGTGTILRADGTNWVATTATYPTTTTVSEILYSSSTNVISGITTAASGILVTSAGGVPSIATDIPTAVTIGSSYIYRAGGTDVPVSDGGTGLSSLTQYRMLYASAANTLSQTTDLTWDESTLAIAGQQTITNSSAGANIDLLLRNSASAGANVGTAIGFALQSGNAKSTIAVDNNSLTNGRHDLLLCVDHVDDVNSVAFSDAKIIIKGDSNSVLINSALVVNEDSADLDVRIESNGNANMFFVDGGTDRIGVGIGVPEAQYHQVITQGTNPTFTSNWLLEGTASTSTSVTMAMCSGNNSTCSIWFGDQNDEDIGRIIYSHATNTMSIYTNNTIGLEVDSNQDVSIDSTGTGTLLEGSVHAFYFNIPGALSVGDEVTGCPIVIPFTCDIVHYSETIEIPAVGADINWEIKSSSTGSVVYSNILTGSLAASDYSDETNLTGGSEIALTQGYKIHLDITQVGSTTPGSNFTIMLVVRKTGTYT